jgi:ABC-type uncharacterized transport system involved in gliding motility auxiliary subunit
MQRRTIHSGSGLALAAVIAVSAIILANAALTTLRLDLTENRLFTLSDGTVALLESLDEPIALDFYFSRRTLVDFPPVMNYATRVRDLLEEYAAKSGGAIRLTVIEPEPFSETEDQAVASGLQGIAVNAAGDRGYFGLVGANSTDDEAVIAFFQAGREAALEYDITKLIYSLANPDKRVVGIISPLPMFGGSGRGRPWAIVNTLREFFEVRDLGAEPPFIDEEIDLLMVVHPKNPNDEALAAIEQFLLSGRPGLLFLDPLAESDDSQPDPQNPFAIPDLHSNLDFLLDAWGLEVDKGKVAGDVGSAMRVQTRGPRGPQETLYPPWLRLGRELLSADDFTTSELEVIHMGTAGFIQRREDSPLTVTPLIRTSPESMAMERDLILFQRDPSVMLRSFQPENRQLTLAARISGPVKTAFPEGVPGREDAADAMLQEGEINLLLIADSDILSDMFWIRTQSLFGIDMPQPIASNGDFIVNAVENLLGGAALASLRSRGRFSRPFEVVDAIRRDAEEQFREQEQALQAKLDETERRILELQKDGGDGRLILTPEQSAEIERFRHEQLRTRQELRAVQHELQKNIERLGTQLKFINIGLMPLLIALAAIGAGLYRTRRRA